eukprot:6526445-Prymnesium_polylepis.1
MANGLRRLPAANGARTPAVYRRRRERSREGNAALHGYQLRVRVPPRRHLTRDPHVPLPLYHRPAPSTALRDPTTARATLFWAPQPPHSWNYEPHNEK